MNRIYMKFNWYFIFSAFISLGLLSCELNDRDKDKKEIEFSAEPEVASSETIFDGPYIFLEDTTLIVKWIESNMLFEVSVFDKDYSFIEKKFGIIIDTSFFMQKQIELDYLHDYKNVENIIAVSDIHGQFFVLEGLLKKYNVIDDLNDWVFGSGHLVINGDIFDRGGQVTEILWLMYKLKNQAEQAGGKVHYLLGNHELMVLNKDLRYINKRYVSTELMMQTTYDQLFSEDNVIGQWLRTSPVILSINDILFVHAGISPEFIEKGISQKNTNSLFQNKIIGPTDEPFEDDLILNFLTGSNGPIWYRGYFSDSTFTEKKLDRILEYFDKKRIVVGHTSFDSIVSLFGGRILGIDASIKKGKYGELLIYEQDKFYRGTLDADKIEIK